MDFDSRKEGRQVGYPSLKNRYEFVRIIPYSGLIMFALCVEWFPCFRTSMNNHLRKFKGVIMNTMKQAHYINGQWLTGEVNYSALWSSGRSVVWQANAAQRPKWSYHPKPLVAHSQKSWQMSIGSPFASSTLCSPSKRNTANHSRRPSAVRKQASNFGKLDWSGPLCRWKVAISNKEA